MKPSFVTFQTPEDVKKALERHKEKLNSATINIFTTETNEGMNLEFSAPPFKGKIK